MGVIRRGANGGFSGKAGSVIGSSWKSIDYIKGLYKKRTKPATQEQLMQQAKFNLIVRFLLPIKALIRIGYGHRKATTHTPMNVAMQQNISRAVAGDYPAYTIDYSRVSIAEGYDAGTHATATASNGTLTVTWETVLSGLNDQAADDRVYVLLYHPGLDRFLTPPTTPLREDGTVELALPETFRTGGGHGWLFTTDRKGRNVSRSAYLGEVTLA